MSRKKPPPPSSLSRTNWTRLVPRRVLTGHVTPHPGVVSARDDSARTRPRIPPHGAATSQLGARGPSRTCLRRAEPPRRQPQPPLVSAGKHDARDTSG
jgi:hypothetical protein